MLLTGLTKTLTAAHCVIQNYPNFGIQKTKIALSIGNLSEKISLAVFY